MTMIVIYIYTYVSVYVCVLVWEWVGVCVCYTSERRDHNTLVYKNIYLFFNRHESVKMAVS